MIKCKYKSKRGIYIIKHVFSKISNIGITNETIENQFIKSSNRAAFTAMMITFPYVIIYLLIDNPKMTIINACLFILYPLAILLNHMHRYILGKILLITLGYIHVTAVSVYYGSVTGFELYFYLMPIISVFIFSKKEQKIMLYVVLSYFLFFFLTQYLYTIITPQSISPEIAKILYYSSIVFIMLFLMSFVFSFRISSLTFQEDLEDQRKLAEEANEAKSIFLANMSHEIRTPMGAILGFVEQLSKNEKDKERQKYFSIIKNSSKTLLNVINDILDFSKIESGKINIEKHKLLLLDFMDETLALFNHKLKNKDINFRFNYSENLPKEIVADSVRLKQVIMNLISNAIKFTSPKGSITVEVEYIDNNIIFSVTDTGIGIAKENLTKILNPFEQEDDSTTRKFGGTGLGLSISSKLISLMGGELKIESELEKGSKFHFNIPYIKNSDSLKEETNLIKQEKNTQNNLNEKTFEGDVLIVEDNKTNQILLGLILEKEGVTFDIANDGVESIDMYQKKDYGAIFMDENMPNMNGIEATKNIRKIEKNENKTRTPIISVTANALAEDRKRFIDAGADEYISKPYTEEDIKLILNKFC